MPIPFAPGFPTDWPVRPANYLQLDWLAHTRNFIHIWLPEGVQADGGNALFILNEAASFSFTHPADDLWVTGFEKPGAIAIKGQCRCIHDGVELSLEVRNLSSGTWQRTSPGVCVQLIAAPDFADTALERTCTVSGGRLIAAAQPKRDHVTHHYRMSEPATENFIAVRSRKPGFVVAQWWQGPPAGVGGNCHPSIACIHAQPSLGRMDPGQSARAVGRLYLMPGDVPDAYERYLKEHH